MLRRAAWPTLALAALLATVAVNATARDEGEADERLRRRLEFASATSMVSVGDERVHASTSLQRFYQERQFAPAWWEGGRPSSSAREIVRAVRAARDEGLRPGDYHLYAIEARWPAGRARIQDPAVVVDLDLLLTDAFLMLGSHYLSGRLNPESIDPEWFVSRREGDVVRQLHAALEAERVEQALSSLLPRHAGYARLKRALAEYRETAAAGGWPSVPDGPKLERGSEGPRVDALRRRLSGNDTGSDSGAGFDEGLEAAVRRFQERHGLEPDGVVGPKTVAALNVPAAARARQVAVNMERWRWLPQDLGERHVLVNIAGFWLEYHEPDAETLSMKVIVGRGYRRTPVFSQKMTHVVVNPFWEVPHNIAVQDILPQVKKDPGYLAKQGMALLQGWGASERRIEPGTVDWASMTRAGFRYRLRQSPGPKNALGRIKFMLPNRFNVYLHDTPARELFSRSERAFSSGCIRLERPFDLAERLLATDARWTPKRLAVSVEKGREETIWLPLPVPVHLLYWTAWVADSGEVRFQADVYGRDRLVEEALREDPPSATEGEVEG